MAALSALAIMYLGLAFIVARSSVLTHNNNTFASKCAISLAIIMEGLCWPSVFWRIIKHDWDNGFQD